MTKPTVKLIEPPKQKRGKPINSTNKQAKKNQIIFDFYYVFGQIWVISILDILNHIVYNFTWLLANYLIKNSTFQLSHLMPDLTSSSF